jgi:hypothetical protein
VKERTSELGGQGRDMQRICGKACRKCARDGRALAPMSARGLDRCEIDGISVDTSLERMDSLHRCRGTSCCQTLWCWPGILGSLEGNGLKVSTHLRHCRIRCIG